MNDPNIKQSLIYTLKIVMCIYSKIGIKRPVYRDYMFKKSIPDKIIETDSYGFIKDKNKEDNNEENINDFDEIMIIYLRFTVFIYLTQIYLLIIQK